MIKKRGRKPVQDRDIVKSGVIQIKVTKGEKELLIRQSENADKTLSRWIYDTLYDRFLKEIKKANKEK